MFQHTLQRCPDKCFGEYEMWKYVWWFRAKKSIKGIASTPQHPKTCFDLQKEKVSILQSANQKVLVISRLATFSVLKLPKHKIWKMIPMAWHPTFHDFSDAVIYAWRLLRLPGHQYSTTSMATICLAGSQPEIHPTQHCNDPGGKRNM